MSNINRLILNYDNLSQKTNALFEELRTSRAKQALFITDPATVISHRILDGKKLTTAAEIDLVNRLLFALLSNPKF